MCWETSSRAIKRKAKHSITIYKVVYERDGSYCGPFYSDFIYQFGVITPKVELVPVKYGYCTLFRPHRWTLIHKGYHCYSTFTKAAEQYTKLDNKHLHIVQGYIPKGTYYYKNKYGDIVAEQLVLTIKHPSI